MSEKYYVDKFEFQSDEGDDIRLNLEDAEAVNQDGGELADTIVTYDGSTGDSISSFTDFINNFVSGTKVGRWFKDFKAGVEYILHIGSLVNNCVTDNADLPLSAAQGKVLMDELTQVKSDLTELDLTSIPTRLVSDFHEEGDPNYALQIIRYNTNTLNTPYSEGLSNSGWGWAFKISNSGLTLIYCFPAGGLGLWCQRRSSSSADWGTWTQWH